MTGAVTPENENFSQSTQRKSFYFFILALWHFGTVFSDKNTIPHLTYVQSKETAAMKTRREFIRTAALGGIAGIVAATSLSLPQPASASPTTTERHSTYRFCTMSVLRN